MGGKSTCRLERMLQSRVPRREIRSVETGNLEYGYHVSERLHYLNVATKMESVYLGVINFVPFCYCSTNCPSFIKKLK
jgi:hypothetical protein